MTTHCLAVWLGWRANHAECLSRRFFCRRQARGNSFFLKSVVNNVALRALIAKSAIEIRAILSSSCILCAMSEFPTAIDLSFSTEWV